MKFAVALIVACFAAVALAAPLEDKDATVLRYTAENIGVDGYQFGYEQSNGQQLQEQGVLKNFGEDSAVVVRGSFSYISPEGQQITVNYVADENGFQPQGDHLPVAPEA